MRDPREGLIRDLSVTERTCDNLLQALANYREADSAIMLAAKRLRELAGDGRRVLEAQLSAEVQAELTDLIRAKRT